MKKILSLFAIILTMLTISGAKAEEGDVTAKKILVAYFSATGTTAQVAEKLAAVTAGDLFEIKPEQPYTAADLNWRNDKSRSSVEMADRTSRPAIVSKVADMSRYEVVFIGFPIWWGREPSVIDTFAESYDFTGKKIIPFATSGSSDIGDSGDNLQALAPQAVVLHGKRFSADVSEAELQAWFEQLP